MQTALPVIIQATNRSSVMNNKSLLLIDGANTVMAYLIKRLADFWPGQIVLATSMDPMDDTLCEEAARLGFSYYRGEKDNLISRLSSVAKQLDCNDFIRVYGNYPLLDLQAMNRLSQEHLRVGADYSYNGHRAGLPWGMECEVLAVSVLERLLMLDMNREQLENATLYMRQNPNLFKICRTDMPSIRPNYKLALETEKDLTLIRDIVRHVNKPDFDTVAAYLDDHPILAASNQETPPKEVGMEKLFLYPDKIGRLKEAAETIDDSYPISVELSLTNRCNLNCVFCSDKDLRNRQGVRETLDSDTLFPLFQDLKNGGTKGVVIEGGGEPTIHQEFDRIIEYIDDLGLGIGLITNGIRPLPPSILKRFEWIRVSLDASTPEEYRALKGLDAFEQVMANIHSYAQSCATVGVGYVVTDQSVGELEALVMRLRQLGASYIQFRPVVDCPELFTQDHDLSYLKSLETHSFAVIIDGMVENAGTGNGELPCLAHSLTTVISADGAVYICGRLNIHDWLKPVGNISEQPFSQIWTGQERHRQAAQVLDPSFCKEFCPQCRITKFNQLFNRINRVKTNNFI